MNIKTSKQSLYVTLGIIIIATVAIIISLQSAYTYSKTKSKYIENIKRSSTETIVSLKNNVANYIQSYSVNEYEKLVMNEMSDPDIFAIVIEDFNMAKIVGMDTFITGKIRGINKDIVDYNSENPLHRQKLAQCYFNEKYDIISSRGNKLGVISICISDQTMKKELNNIITNTVITGIIFSFLLVAILFLAIRAVVLKPLSDIIQTLKNSDEAGMPLAKIPAHGSSEVYALANTMNNMISTIKNSSFLLDEQHKELLANEDQLRTLSMATEQSPVSIIICSPKNSIEYVNPQFEKTSGYRSTEVLGKSITFLFEYNDRDKAKIDSLDRCLVKGLTWIDEITPVSKQGQSYTIRISASPIKIHDGSVSHNVYVAENITAHIKNEMLLRNSQKMEAIGQLTGGIAHDFNNLLGIIMGNLELLKMDLESRPELIEKIEQAYAGTVRGAQLTRKLLNFSRMDNHIKEITCINPHVEHMRDLVAKSVTAAINVETNLADDLWLVDIDPGDLEDAILNLSINARDAMPNGGQIIIETKNVHLDEGFVYKYPTAREGDFVMLSICDTGTGISEDMQKKIFDPFFTTKEFGKGSGLGLSMVYGFVQRSGGHIQIDSAPGQGACFHLYFPKVKSGKDESVQEEKVKMPHGNNETVLIVDDEEDLLDLTSGYLQRLGYKYLIARSAQQALDILASNEKVDLLITDIVMPETDGYELTMQCVQRWPDMKILLTSGFSTQHDKLNELEPASRSKISEQILDKPYSMKDLAVAVRNSLDTDY